MLQRTILTAPELGIAEFWHSCLQEVLRMMRAGEIKDAPPKDVSHPPGTKWLAMNTWGNLTGAISGYTACGCIGTWAAYVAHQRGMGVDPEFSKDHPFATNEEGRKRLFQLFHASYKEMPLCISTAKVADAIEALELFFQGVTLSWDPYIERSHKTH